MPELPEVEVLRRGLNPALQGRKLIRLDILNPSLRWPVSQGLGQHCMGQRLIEVARRAKYLLFRFPRGAMLVHLGMSGTVQWLEPGSALQKHDHVLWQFEGAPLLRFNDPRRFGSVLWLSEDRMAEDSLSKPMEVQVPQRAQALLDGLGLEPFDPLFSGQHLYRKSRKRRLAVKPWLLSGEPVVGVGNIYACEALFRAGIDPRRSIGRISLSRYERLAQSIAEVLLEAIAAGGSSLRDFVSSQGHSGAFQKRHAVYSREGDRCERCGERVKRFIQAQRSSFACFGCQR